MTNRLLRLAAAPLVLAALAALAAPVVWGRAEYKRIKKTEANLRLLVNTIDARANADGIPEDAPMPAIIAWAHGDPKLLSPNDAWGRPLHYHAIQHGLYVIASAGADGKLEADTDTLLHLRTGDMEAFSRLQDRFSQAQAAAEQQRSVGPWYPLRAHDIVVTRGYFLYQFPERSEGYEHDGIAPGSYWFLAIGVASIFLLAAIVASRIGGRP
jgi:hypothetical protein